MGGPMVGALLVSLVAVAEAARVFRRSRQDLGAAGAAGARLGGAESAAAVTTARGPGVPRLYFLRKHDCSICLHNVCDTAARCGHRFHDSCLQEWVRVQQCADHKPSCPNCKRPLLEPLAEDILQGLREHAVRHPPHGLHGVWTPSFAHTPGIIEEVRPGDVPANLWTDRTFVLRAVALDGRNLQHAPTFQGDVQVVLAAIQSDPAGLGAGSLFFAAPSVRGNREVVFEAVQRDRPCFVDTLPVLSVASQKLQDDPYIVLEAVRHRPGAFRFASTRLKDNKDVVRECAIIDPALLRHASPNLRGQREFVLQAVQNFGPPGLPLLLKSMASDELWADKQFVMPVVGRFPQAFQFAAESLRDDEEVTLTALRWAGIYWTKKKRRPMSPFRYASPRLQGRRDFVLKAVELDGMALAFAKVDRLDDHEKVQLAARQNGQAQPIAANEDTRLDGAMDEE